MIGLVVVFGAALSWFSAVHPAEMPAWGPWEFSWVEYLGCVLPAVWYVRGIRRMAPETRPAPWRQACYGLGMAAIYAVVQTRLTFLAQHLFVATQVQQFVLHDIGPFLVALSWPLAPLREGMPAPVLRALRAPPVQTVFRAVQQPVVAAVLFILLLAGQVVPAVVFRMMLDWRVFDAMNILVAADGVLFWCLVLDPRPRPLAGISYLTRMVLIFVVMLPVMPVGAYIAFTSRALYGFYDFCGRLDWVSPASDQILGGLMLWIPSGLMTAVAILLPLNAMRLAEEREGTGPRGAFIEVGQRRIDASAWTGR